ncbi:MULTISPECIES: hypothetical protein [unclassified Bradyrhizobium]|uniref:hypothetical protein n=1 Tax=unclassified Bradyrhizobium TaxID=2631580 RepID=UPI001FF79AEA|nr:MULTISPECIES: hypothetical protein [unclassified Bradyrhizobium]MCK1319275.1 hypothetical protein [Bradyrhizobium sp. 23]MCK1401888.1 hypothetical protein [Bradyrhizobium sp. 39]MCK1746401.1 hypothetical protein [Bradyrhizobium sp. 135]UPJ39062.1 hypothetical protein IVB45_38085 [Bradyrhizobium sp. 4]
MIYSRNLRLGGHNGQVFVPRIYDQSMVAAAPPKSAADGSWRDVERKLIGAGSTAISIQPF